MLSRGFWRRALAIVAIAGVATSFSPARADEGVILVGGDPVVPVTPAPAPVTPPPPPELPELVPSNVVPTFVQISQLTSPVSRNEWAQLFAGTDPGAVCSIFVDGLRDYSPAVPGVYPNLYPKQASMHGVLYWSWLVGPNTPPGEWRITVTCGAYRDWTYYTVR